MNSWIRSFIFSKNIYLFFTPSSITQNSNPHFDRQISISYLLMKKQKPNTWNYYYLRFNLFSQIYVYLFLTHLLHKVTYIFLLWRNVHRPCGRQIVNKNKTKFLVLQFIYSWNLLCYITFKYISFVTKWEFIMMP